MQKHENQQMGHTGSQWG